MTLLLQTCSECGAVQYPRRAVCRRCLSGRLADAPVADGGTLLAVARIEVTLDPAWSAALPCLAGTVLLDAGVKMIVMVAGDIAAGTRVRVALAPGPTGQPLFTARAEDTE